MPSLVRLVIALVLGALAFAPTASAQTAPYFGYNDLSPLGGTITWEGAADLAKRSGATSTRFAVEWPWVEYQESKFSWGSLDGMYWRNIERGIRPLITVYNSPTWARDPNVPCSSGGTSCKLPHAPAFDGHWQRFLRHIATRYPNAAGIEIWNEANLRWTWDSGPDPVRYTELLKLAHEAVKSVNPSMPVIASGLAPVFHDRIDTQSAGLRPFLDGMYRNGAARYMDALAVHPYPYDVDFGNAFRAMSILKETRDMHGDSRPVWVTEFGFSSAGSAIASEYNQGITVPNLTGALRKDPDVRGIYVHSLVENHKATASLEDQHFGSLRPDFSPKPVYCGLAAVNGASWRCPKKTTTATPSTTQLRRWDAQVLLQAAADAARKVHAKEGRYLEVTAADLNAEDPRILPETVTGNLTPGRSADPRRIAVYPTQDGQDGILLCNASKADMSYCIFTYRGGMWKYGALADTVWATAGAITSTRSMTW